MEGKVAVQSGDHLGQEVILVYTEKSASDQAARYYRGNSFGQGDRAICCSLILDIWELL